MRRSALAVSAGYAAIAAGVTGAIYIVIGVAALPDPWTGGYISEAGASSAPQHSLYRAGILLVSIALGLLALAVATAPGASPVAHPLVPRWFPSGWVLLLVAAGLGAGSSRVSCTTGCPLPPYQATTARDLVHAGTSVVAVGFVALSMLVIALAHESGAVRRLARWGAAVCWPPLVFLAIAILAVGHGALTAITERIAVALVLFWALATAAVIARRL